MWIKRIVARSPMSALRSGGSTGRHTWILLAMIHLTMDFTFCSPVTQGPVLKPLSKPVPRHKAGPGPLWDPPSRFHWRALGPWWQRALRPALPLSDKVGKTPMLAGQKHRGPAHKGPPCKECQSKHSSTEVLDSLASPGGRNSDTMTFLIRRRRQLKWDSYEKSQDGRTTTVPGFIDWGPTGGEDGGEDDGRVVPNSTVSTKALTTTITTTVTTTTTTTKRHPQTNFPVVTTLYPRRQSTTPSSIIIGETAKPVKPIDTAGLAVHQIITITVSLIMVIAALITTLVLKNCCAQSGSGRHSSHQRKINQQEESCQNLTDFTPARVPSNVDIFTAYNDSLQCSHECVRTAVPIYTDEMIQQTPVYKTTTYNGNRPSPTERQLIPVAFVSEKWFEISC
ncbi:hypothetical protein AGOR_G00135110 [Albula goreensis]|uniref:AJAP1/PANP C-terminal domain-containing protein n=1 Tax=Albula goreensis TaxID=1534307 RepID=A0A8T3D8G5_9TELE|nr:hypothetical protein AGOR_G00135110 [Albula goreensis]